MEDDAVRKALEEIKGKEYSFGHVSAAVYPDFRREPPVYAGFECSLDRGFVDGLKTAINLRAKQPAKIEIIALEEGHTKTSCIAEIIPAGPNKAYETRQFAELLPRILREISIQYGAAKAQIEKRKEKPKRGEWRGINPHFHNSRRI